MTRFLNLRPPYSSVRIASFRKFNKFSAHVQMAANCEMKKTTKDNDSIWVEK